MEPGLAQLVEHLTVVVEHISCTFHKCKIGIKLSLVRFRQPGTVFL